MVTTSPATAADVAEIAVVLGEIEQYYGGAGTPGDPAQIRAALFGERPLATVLLARDGDTVLGLASYTYLWPAGGSGSSLFLKELYVRAPHRRRGVAGVLMAALREVAARSGCSRMEWTADRSNPSALAFYAALGARPHEDKVFYRLPLPAAE